MKKKKSGGGGANWMDTYGDMVTLLLCFFVLLYSMSTVDESKWKALVQSFNPNAVLTATDPSGLGGPFADPEAGLENPGMNQPDDLKAAQEEIDTAIDQLYQSMQQMVKDKGLETTVQVTMEGGKVFVQFRDTVFFSGDSYVLQPQAREILLEVCHILDAAKGAIDEVRVQGHTAQAYANVRNPAEGDRFLASNRATTVVLFLQENSQIHPARLVPESFGQWRPISSNATAELRAPNRRVEMVISGRDLDAEALNNALADYITRDDSDLTTAQ